MERQEAIQILNKLIGKDLRPLAEKYGISVFNDKNSNTGKFNKGWAGHTIERVLGLPLNSSRSPNFGSWELKVIPLRRLKNGKIVAKETMAITMLDPIEVSEKKFEESHVFNKLKKILILAREFRGRSEENTIVYSIGSFDLTDKRIFNIVKADYDLIRATIKTKGFAALKGEMGTLMQPRTKGPGHGSTSRAFYARKAFVEHMIGLNKYTKMSI